MGWLALLAVAVFARAAALAAGIAQASVAAVIAFALAIAGPTWLGRLTSDLSQATLLMGGLCAIGAWWLRRRARPPGGGSSPGGDAAAQDGGPTPWVLRVPILAATAQVVWAALGSHFWDEHSCHYSTAAVIARGVFPPEHPLFPGEPFRYHFGYDVVAAHVRDLTGVPIDVALDVATIASFLLLLAVCRDVGRAAGGRWGGGFAMLLVPLGGGTLAFLLFGDMGPLELHWNALPRDWSRSTPPPVISNFFQHPQGLGMSFGLAIVGVFGLDPRDPIVRRRHVAVAAGLLGVLALVHIVFFAVLGLALGVHVVVRALQHGRYRALVEELGALLAALAIGYSLGGFFAPGPPMGQVLRWGTSFFHGGLGAVLAQHLVLFGLPLVMLPWAVLQTARRPRGLAVTMVAAALIGFVVPNVVTYARSWDIVKFLGIGMFFANALLALQLAAWVRAGRGAAAAAAVATVLATNTAWVWLLRVSVLDGRYGVPKIHFPPSSRVGHTVGREIDALIPPRDRVFSTDVQLARATGFLTPGFDWRQVGVGFMLDRARAERLYRAKQRARRSLEPRAMAELGVRWAVIAPADLAFLDDDGRRRLEDPTWYREVADVGQGPARRLVYRMLPPAYGGEVTR